MKNTYKNFETNVYKTLGYGYIPDTLHDDIFEKGLVDTYPDPERPCGRQGNRRPLRICVYRDFKFTETKNTRYGCLFTVEYIPTGEIIAKDLCCMYTIEHFIWWWYNK